MEHRRSPRTRTILQGRVVFNNRFSLIECTVRDLSETGAQITFSHPVSLPPELELEIPKKGLSTRAKVMWSRGYTMDLCSSKQRRTRLATFSRRVRGNHGSGQELPARR